MILSMTGFGEARLEEDAHAYHLEIRTVNNRYLKASIHLPDEFGFLETEVERLIRQKITRGSASLRLHVRDLSAAAAQEINTSAIHQYIEQLRHAVADDPRTRIDLATLATLPGVCQPRDLTEAQREQTWELIQRLTTTAMEHLLSMRQTEGRAITADLTAHCDLISRRLASIRERVPAVVAEFRDRLLSRVQELLNGSGVKLAEQDLLKEVSIYAERSDISEEVSRLASHGEQFLRLMGEREPSGRKLEFVAQEMLREANTMGSKTGDGQIARDVVEIKAAIDRIKEQVMNVE
ncbi:Conserved hypothetical protein CHP00255 [Phycisphaerae bacterium RAS1]|nr:Conserved hypothetical protein CHP00255 [Phycisphaerae bacterium RAS1]